MLVHFTDVMNRIDYKSVVPNMQNIYVYPFTAKLILSNLFALWFIFTVTLCFHVVLVPNTRFSTQSEKKVAQQFLSGLK